MGLQAPYESRERNLEDKRRAEAQKLMIYNALQKLKDKPEYIEAMRYLRELNHKQLEINPINLLAPRKQGINKVEPKKRVWKEWCISADRELVSLSKEFGQDWNRVGLIMERDPSDVKKR